MDKLRFFDRKIVRGGLVLGFGALALSSCGAFDHNYEGEGNEFTISGPILDIGDDSIKIMPLEITETNGEADGWFDEDDETRIHDNYENEWCNAKEVGGVVYDAGGEEVEMHDLEEGDWVEVEGRIRESKTSCGKTPTWDDRPVFEEVREIIR
jgi:hypothetical protein